MLIEDPSPSVGQEAIKLFERLMDCKFPNEYRNFLLQQNGGYPVPSDFSFADGTSGSSIQEFLKINSDKNHDDLLWNVRTFRQRVPREFMPIASDPGGNLICIGIRGPHYGKIYFWDHESEVDDDCQPTMDNMILVAPNFSKFLDGLSEVL